MLKLFIWGALFSSLSLHAGNESHGGDIVVCANQPPVVLDYFHASLKAFGEEKANIEDISSWSRERVILYFRNKLQNYIFRFEFESALLKFGDMDKWIEADLKEVEDSDEPYFLPKDCQRVQAAIRHGNELFVDPSWVRKLTPAQEGILVVHEAMFYVANQHKVETSGAVRELVRALLRKDSTDLQILRAIKSTGAMAYAFEAIASNYYYYSQNSGSVSFRLRSLFDRTLDIILGQSGYRRAQIKCDSTGMHCQLIDTTNQAGSPFSWEGATVDFEDGMRRFVIQKPGTNLRAEFVTDSTPPFPIPSRR